MSEIFTGAEKKHRPRGQITVELMVNWHEASEQMRFRASEARFLRLKQQRELAFRMELSCRVFLVS